MTRSLDEIDDRPLDRRPRVLEVINRVLRDDPGAITAEQVAFLVRHNLTGNMVKVLREHAWHGAHLDPDLPERTLRAYIDRGLATRTGQLTRPGVALGRLLGPEDEAGT